MSKFMTYDYWLENFRPIKNIFSKDEHQIAYETYGEEVEFVAKQDPKTIWTEVDGDSGTYIIAGYHYINRFQYYITEEAWDDEFTEIPTWCYRQCDCTEDEANEDYGYDPDCPECEEGTIDVECETVQNLVDIYGEDVEILG